jgi:MoaA/NifB/PqqE/SkfB family radical SAM enzyme
MRFPVHITLDMVRHQTRHALRGSRRYPFVLMLEPLYTCNLACLGCSTERYTGKLKDRLPLETCLEAVEDCGAPSVSICGGEPTLYPELADLVDGIIARRRHIYLCTNALLLDDKVYGVIPPHRRLTLNIHLDGMLVAPGYQYESVARDMFLTRNEIHAKFKEILSFSRRYRLSSTPMFLEFAAGLREYACSPWSTVTFTPKGWKGPCYLIGERYVSSWDEFWNGTDWEYWESRQDDRCQNCAMHSGFEASVVREVRRNPGDMVRLLAWNLFS